MKPFVFTIIVWLNLISDAFEIQPLPQQVNERATVTLYRRKDYASSSFQLKINGVLITEKFTNNSYMVLEVPAGRLQIETHERKFFGDKKKMVFNLKPNEPVFLKSITDYEFLSESLYFRRIPQEKATEEMKKLKEAETLIKQLE